jgi:hypothetical protein
MGGFVFPPIERGLPMTEEKTTKNSFTKKIDRATYTVRIFFNQNSKESFNDKLLRVIKNDIRNESQN